jgi:hypothetical protein
LVWETGEWDPVAGYEELGDSSDEDDDEPREEKVSTTSKDQGKWMKREIEIVESTRRIGFCVDGMEARVRVEMKK